MLIEPLAIDTPIAGFNGGLFVNADMAIIQSYSLDPAVARKAAEAIEQQGLDVWIYAGDDWLIRDEKAAHVDREEHAVRFAPNIVTAFSDEAFAKAVKIAGVSDDLDKVAACEKHVQQVLGDHAPAARSQPYYLDVTNPEANKGSVAIYLANKLGIPLEQTATIGDMPNDVLMFKRGGFSIAMGNASSEVQSQADAVIDDFENEGFAKAVKRFILV